MNLNHGSLSEDVSVKLGNSMPGLVLFVTAPRARLPAKTNAANN